jgi:hypothetical protein
MFDPKELPSCLKPLPPDATLADVIHAINEEREQNAFVFVAPTVQWTSWTEQWNRAFGGNVHYKP